MVHSLDSWGKHCLTAADQALVATGEAGYVVWNRLSETLKGRSADHWNSTGKILILVASC